MKTVPAVIVVALAPFVLLGQSQIGQGVYSVSGSMSLAFGSADLQGTTQRSMLVGFSPSASVFVLDQIEVAIEPTYVTSSTETTIPGQTGVTSSNTSLGVVVGLRFYFPLEAVAPFVGVGGGVSWMKFSSGTITGAFSQPRKQFIVEAGFDYFITHSFAIEPGIQYRGVESLANSKRDFSISAGVKYFIL